MKTKPTLQLESTGDESFDTILGGGLPAQSVVVIAGEPGSGKTVLTLQILFRAAREGKKSLYFTTLAEPAIKVLRYMQLFAFFDAALADKQIIIADLSAAVRKGADGIKFFGAPPAVMDAALRENKRLGLRSACHHTQVYVARWNVLNSAKAGLTSMEHWYGLPEALFTDKTIQDYRLDYNYQNEQHRFGVQQRMQLQEKGRKDGRFPHQLIMTATPIPRTLAMTAYADLDISVIDELPPGRTPIKTVVIPEEKRAAVVARIVEACREGRQAYWVCPLIEESEELRSQAAEETAASLAEALPGVRVGLVHGRMPSAKKDEAMLAFKDGKIQLLVATTVIEVGVDVPNSTLMVIENAERMGLAQLHQLRGRVGRGTSASTCVLLYRAPLSQLARERLKAIRETNDGFEIARKDLELRGPGELLGTRQTGLAQLRVADLVRDADLLPCVQETAELLLASYPDNIAALAMRWVGTAERYGRVG